MCLVGFLLLSGVGMDCVGGPLGDVLWLRASTLLAVEDLMEWYNRLWSRVGLRCRCRSHAYVPDKCIGAGAVWVADT